MLGGPKILKCIKFIIYLYSSDIGIETGAKLVSFTNRKNAWAGWSWRRRLMILINSPTVTWSGIKNFVLSKTGSCFSPLNLSMMHGTFEGCSDLICSTSFTLKAEINSDDLMMKWKFTFKWCNKNIIQPVIDFF